MKFFQDDDFHFSFNSVCRIGLALESSKLIKNKPTLLALIALNTTLQIDERNNKKTRLEVTHTLSKILLKHRT